MDAVRVSALTTHYRPSYVNKEATIRSYFESLFSAWGPQHWWPADSTFEVIVGAILTQNTAWTNVDKALTNLRRKRLLSVEGIRCVPLAELEELIRSAGYFRQKAARLKSFVHWLDVRYDGSPATAFGQPTDQLRCELLEINGIGPETADSILLYAGQHEIFVVDAYTRRVFERHKLVTPAAKYDEIRFLVEAALQGPPGAPKKEPAELSYSVESGPGPVEELPVPLVHLPTKMSEATRSGLAQRYNEFHGLIVQLGKHYCQSRVARCELCPLRGYLRRPIHLSNSKGKGQRAKRKPGL